MPTFSDRLTLNTTIIAVALFFTALVLFQLGPFAPVYPRSQRTESILIEHHCARCSEVSFFTAGQDVHCRKCQSTAAHGS